MAEYPLKPYQPTQFLDRSPSAQTDESAAYKNMLGPGAAGEDVGLFYQLNRTANGITETDKYGINAPRGMPIEANSRNA